MSPRAAKLKVGDLRPAITEGSDPVCPQCGGPVTHRSDSMGYGVTVEQCAQGLRQCDYWRTLERRVRPELARRPMVEETKRVRRSPGLAPVRAPKRRRPTKDASRLRVLLMLPITSESPETPAQLAAALQLSPGFVKCCLTDLKAEGKADYRVQRVAGKTGRPAHAWWRVA